VHGHSPIEQACHYGNRVNLDSGAGYGQPLTAAVFEELRCSILTAQGRRKISMAA
jgi:serine/threonine protein phosphatase 1